MGASNPKFGEGLERVNCKLMIGGSDLHTDTELHVPYDRSMFVGSSCYALCRTIRRLEIFGTLIISHFPSSWLT